ncbi:helix-turn-helix domain-containing protein [Atopobacter sp. AH10]|uniref:helix-turn-helix domain-containing protein n=1 Tax=Atopobacter sp. AH10 TaxID=2315861 RepID=UPI001314E606|nr:helix-turn-helix domain-containing protein [Atopobacter sp. AH10]
MQFTEFLIVGSVKEHPVKINTLKHILLGKRTSFQLLETLTNRQLAYFGSLPYSRSQTYGKEMQGLIEEGKIYLKDQQLYLSDTGKKCYEESKILYRLGDYSFMRYSAIQKNLLEFYKLFLQYLSYKKKEKPFNRHIPASYFTLQVLRRFCKEEPDFDTDQFLQELYTAFDSFYNEWGDIFWGQISGFEIAGLSDQVLSYFSPLIEESSDWFFLQVLLKLERKCPSVKKINQFLLRFFPLVSETVLSTSRLYRQGMSVNDICQFRRIKPSTVYDHLFEYQFFYPNFTFISSHDKGIIQEIQKLEEAGKLSFDQLKEALSYPKLPYSYVLFARMETKGGVPWI